MGAMLRRGWKRSPESARQVRPMSFEIRPIVFRARACIHEERIHKPWFTWTVGVSPPVAPFEFWVDWQIDHAGGISRSGPHRGHCIICVDRDN